MYIRDRRAKHMFQNPSLTSVSQAMVSPEMLAYAPRNTFNNSTKKK